MISHHRKRGHGDGLDRVSETYPHAEAPQIPQGQPMDTPEADEISDEEFLDMNHSSPLVEPQPSAEQRGRSRRDERSRSRERANTSTFISARFRWKFSNRGSTKSRKRPFKVTSRTGRLTKKLSTTTATWFITAKRKENCCWKSNRVNHQRLRKHKSTDSDEDDEEPQNEPGSSSNTQPIGPVLPFNSGDEDSEHSEAYSAQSQDTGRTVPYPDLYVLTNEEHWTMTPATHKYAAAAGSFGFSITEGWRTTRCMQFDHHAECATIIIISMKRPTATNLQMLKFLMELMVKQETCWNAVWLPAEELQGTRANMRSRARKEPSAQEVRGYYKQQCCWSNTSWIQFIGW